MGNTASRRQASPHDIIAAVGNNSPAVVKVSFCRHHQLDHAQIQRLFACLMDNNHVRTLKLTGVGVEDADVGPLVTSLEVNRTLEKLKLEDNHLSGRAMVSIVRAIGCSHSLRKLSLRGNKVMDLQEELQISSLVRSNNTLIRCNIDFHFTNPAMNVEMKVRDNRLYLQKRLQNE